jgi:hypothetical protein
MTNMARLLTFIAVIFGSASAPAALLVNGTAPGCISPGGPTPETFCNSGFTATLNTTNGFDFSLMFENHSYVETLLSGLLEVDLFFQPSNFPDQILTATNFGLLDTNGNDLGIAFDRVSMPGEIRFASSSLVSASTLISGLHLAMTCDDTNFPGACDTGLTFGTLAIAMDDNIINGVDQHSLQAGRLTTVPEPSTLALLSFGLAGVGAVGRKKRVRKIHSASC